MVIEGRPLTATTFVWPVCHHVAAPVVHGEKAKAAENKLNCPTPMKHAAKIDVAVLILFFNRPEPFEKVFQAVKAARPSRLFLY